MPLSLPNRSYRSLRTESNMRIKSFAFIAFGILLSTLIVLGQTKSPRTNSKPARSVVQAETLEQQIGRISRSYGIDARLFQSLIYTESVFKIRAVSYKGAACYTQLMPATARRFGLRVDSTVDERFNAEKCLSVGAYYLAWLLKTFRGDVRLALAGYNAGEGAVMKYGWRIPPYRETVQYVEKICALYFNQSGHGVAMAYNQPQAQGWVNALYSARKGKSSPLVINTADTRQLISVAQMVAAAQQNEPIQTTNSIPEKKKPTVTRVTVAEETSPRIRTQSLSFGN